MKQVDNATERLTATYVDGKEVDVGRGGEPSTQDLCRKIMAVELMGSDKRSPGLLSKVRDGSDPWGKLCEQPVCPDACVLMTKRIKNVRRHSRNRDSSVTTSRRLAAEGPRP